MRMGRVWVGAKRLKLGKIAGKRVRQLLLVGPHQHVLAVDRDCQREPIQEMAGLFAQKLGGRKKAKNQILHGHRSAFEKALKKTRGTRHKKLGAFIECSLP